MIPLTLITTGVHTLLPVVVGLVLLVFAFRIVGVMLLFIGKMFLILVVLTMFGSGLVYTQGYQQALHYFLNLL